MKMPSRKELLAGCGRVVPDVIAPGLRVLFCGINPGLYSGFTGHHFAWPGNRFWPALYTAGFTDRLLAPSEERLLLPSKFGITNLVDRATATAAELTKPELLKGADLLRRKAQRYQPRIIAVLGVSAFRIAFDQVHVRPGRQSDLLGQAVLWILPNPSGLNAHYPPNRLAEIFRELRLYSEEEADS